VYPYFGTFDPEGGIEPCPERNTLVMARIPAKSDSRPTTDTGIADIRR